MSKCGDVAFTRGGSDGLGTVLFLVRVRSRCTSST